jgi:alanine racemase
MIGYNAVQVLVAPQAVADNWLRLQHKGTEMVAVVKADAYGHGLVPVAQALARRGARRFAVGTVAEGVALREALPGVQIIALLGIQDASDAAACRDYGIVPLVTHAGQWPLLRRAAAAADVPLAVILKFDTGMARLGFAWEAVVQVVDALRAAPMLRPVAVFSHLAAADDPEAADFVAEQTARLAAVQTSLAAAGFSVPASLANSAALVAHPAAHFQMQRPGIALYGANPLAGTAWEDRCPPLIPAMTVTAPILQVRDIAPGVTVSYGRTFRASRPMRIAIVAAGYADAYSRGLSGKAAMVVGGVRAPVLGRVCMQMTAVDVTHCPSARPGDRAYLLGGPGEAAITADELAAWWGTIPYEVLCLLGMNPRSMV